MKDTCIGIPKNKHGKIWKSFTQASSSTYRIYGGTGLGLPIVKSILKAMKSNLRVSCKIGVGSRFYFDLELNITQIMTLYNQLKKKNIILLVKKFY